MDKLRKVSAEMRATFARLQNERQKQTAVREDQMSQIISDFKNYRLTAGQSSKGHKGNTADSALSRPQKSFDEIIANGSASAPGTSPGSPANFLILRALEQSLDKHDKTHPPTTLPNELDNTSFDKTNNKPSRGEQPSELASRRGEEVINEVPPVNASMVAPARKINSKMSKSYRDEQGEHCSGLDSVNEDTQLINRGSNILNTDHVDTRIASVHRVNGTAVIVSGEHSQGAPPRSKTTAVNAFGSFMEIDIRATAVDPNVVPDQGVVQLKGALKSGGLTLKLDRRGSGPAGTYLGR